MRTLSPMRAFLSMIARSMWTFFPMPNGGIPLAELAQASRANALAALPRLQLNL